MQTNEAFDAAVRALDARLLASGVTVWVGSETTFTDRQARTPPCHPCHPAPGMDGHA